MNHRNEDVGIDDRERDTWLVGHQARWNAPPEVLADLVRRATGAGIAQDERVLDGEANEVHAVDTTAGDRIIVRIGRRPGPVFERERWPMEAARAAGVPVPEILLIDHGSLEGAAASFSVQRRAPGRSLHRSRHFLSADQRRDVVRQAGRILAALHSVDVPGHGPIGPDGANDWALGYPQDRQGPEEALAATRELIDRGLLERSMAEQLERFVVEHLPVCRDAPLRLIHGNWYTTHLIVEGGSITGVVDWESARGDDPARDLVEVDFWVHYGLPGLETLLVEGYAEAGGHLDDGFGLRLLVLRLCALQGAVAHFGINHRYGELRASLAQLRSCLREARAWS